MLGAAKTLGIELGILADHEALRDLYAAVDHDPTEPGVTADVDLGQNHSAVQHGPGVDVDTGE